MPFLQNYLSHVQEPMVQENFYSLSTKISLTVRNLSITHYYQLKLLSHSNQNRYINPANWERDILLFSSFTPAVSFLIVSAGVLFLECESF